MDFVEFEERPFLLVEEEDGWASDKEYFGSEAISNSDLRVFETEGPAAFWAYKYSPDFVKKPPTESQEFGTLLHTLIYEEKEYEKRYYQFNGKKPASVQMEAFCQDINNGVDVVISYCNSYSVRNLSANQIEEKANFLYDELYQYITGLRRRGNKKLISELLLTNATTAKNNYLLNPSVRDFHEMIIRDSCIVFREHSIFWECGFGFNCRAKVDEIIINHKEKVIYKNDLKSTYNSSPYSFGKSYVRKDEEGNEKVMLTGSIAKWGYDEQVAFYNLAINNSTFKKDYDCNGYQIVNTVFAVRNCFPFNVNAYRFSPKVIDAADNKIVEKMNNIARYMELNSKDFNDWQDYNQKFNNTKGLFFI
jgi:hypothetical protein